MRYDNNKEGIAKWVKEYLEPALVNMPGSSIKSLDYQDISNELRHGQYIKVTYDNDYSRETNVTADSAKGCIYDLVHSSVIE